MRGRKTSVQFQLALAICAASWNPAFAEQCADLFHTLPEAPEVLKATRATLGCGSMEITCNGIPDNQVCENPLVGPAECGKILLNGLLDVSQLCPLMCKTCVDTTTTTTNTETSTTGTTTTTTITTATGTTTTTATTTTDTTTTGTETSTTETTTTTLVCNGDPDPETCTSHGALVAFCDEESNVGYAFRMDCPILCGTCIPTTTTSSTPTTTPMTEAVTTTTEALVYCGAPSIGRATQCQNMAFVGEIRLGEDSSSCYCDAKCKIQGDCCPDFCGVCEGGRPIDGSSPLVCEATTKPPAGPTTSPLVLQDTGTCKNSCGSLNGISTRTGLPARCTCNELCVYIGDCCVDYEAVCVTTRGVTATSTTVTSTTVTTATETTATDTSTTTPTVSCEACALLFMTQGGCPAYWKTLGGAQNFTAMDEYWAPGCEATSSRCSDSILDKVCLSTTATTTTNVTETSTSATVTTVTTATDTTTTSTTPESCDYLLADLVFFFDSSRTVGLAKFIQQTMFACSVVKALEDSLTPGSEASSGKGLRVASIVYSESADIAFDFHSGNGDATAICESLQSIRYKPTDFTRLHTAFEIMRRKLFTSARGYRGPEQGVPTELVVFTHGETLNTLDLATELRLNQPTHMTFVQTAASNATFLGGTLAASPVSQSAVLLLSELDDSSAADVSAAGGIANAILFNAPCAVSCDVKADVIFIFDGSTSIEDASAGGASGNFNLLREFSAETIDRFRYEVANDAVRVGAISFADDAKVHFDLSSLVGQPDLIMYGLRQIAYDHSIGGSDELTDTNLHDALALIRTNIAPDKDFGVRGGTVPLVLVVLTDGKVRNEVGTAVKDLESELAQMSSDVLRIAYGIGTSQSPTMLQMIAGFDGVVGSVLEDQGAARLASTIMTMGEQCAIRQTSTTVGATVATTGGPKPTNGRLVNEDTCMALHPAYSDGCNSLIAAVGCNTEVARLLCASSCSQCANHCHTRNPFRQDECIRCKDGLYLNPDSGMCVSSQLCPTGTIAVQTDDDSDYGRACVAPGGICDSDGLDKQCNPPKSLGSCAVAEVGDFPGEAECISCQMGSFLIDGRCMETFRCQGDEIEQDRSKRCNCNAFTVAGGDEPDKTCARCKIYMDPSFTDKHTDPHASGVPAWLASLLTYEHSFKRGWRQCMECRFGTVFDAVAQSCIAVSECPAEMAVYNPKSTGGACEEPFTCDGIKSTTGEACKCPRRGSCNACHYVAGGGAPECFRCNEGKLLWRAGGNVCIAPKKCARKGGIAFVRDGVQECMPL